MKGFVLLPLWILSTYPVGVYMIRLTVGRGKNTGTNRSHWVHNASAHAQGPDAGSIGNSQPFLWRIGDFSFSLEDWCFFILGFFFSFCF